MERSTPRKRFPRTVSRFIFPVCRSVKLILDKRRLTSIIVSRFFFNLRQADARPGHMGDSAFWSTIHFNSNVVIGNLSEPLDFGALNHEDSTANEGFDSTIEDTACTDGTRVRYLSRFIYVRILTR